MKIKNSLSKVKVAIFSLLIIFLFAKAAAYRDTNITQCTSSQIDLINSYSSNSFKSIVMPQIGTYARSNQFYGELTVSSSDLTFSGEDNNGNTLDLDYQPITKDENLICLTYPYVGENNNPLAVVEYKLVSVASNVGSYAEQIKAKPNIMVGYHIVDNGSKINNAFGANDLSSVLTTLTLLANNEQGWRLARMAIINRVITHQPLNNIVLFKSDPV